MYMAEYATTFCHSMANADDAAMARPLDRPLDDGQGRGQRLGHQVSLHRQQPPRPRRGRRGSPPSSRTAAEPLRRRVPPPPRPSAAASLRRRVPPPPRLSAAASLRRRVPPPPRLSAAASLRGRVSPPPRLSAAATSWPSLTAVAALRKARAQRSKSRPTCGRARAPGPRGDEREHGRWSSQ